LIIASVVESHPDLDGAAVCPAIKSGSTKMKARRLSGLRLILTGTLPAFCCALFAAAPARATFYDITTNSMQVAPGSPCTFPEAIVAITTQASFNGCAAGELTNTIDLKAATYTATIPFNLVAV
jgi:hypothetical protein